MEPNDEEHNVSDSNPGSMSNFLLEACEKASDFIPEQEHSNHDDYDQQPQEHTSSSSQMFWNNSGMGNGLSSLSQREEDEIDRVGKEEK
uniref:Uncharacterized protein n=1 Tax=Acrobeloides nanus TaxID=290746 RepID=A0A914DEQ6_9BILA